MKRDLRDLLFTNWPIKLTALALAAVLWAAVAAEEPTTQLVPVSLVVQPPEGRALTRRLPPVRALYAGSARELIKLYGSPPVITKVIPDTLMSSHYILQLAPEDLRLSERANVQAQDVQPRQIEIVLDDLARRSVAVAPRVRIRPDSGYTLIGGIAVVPSSVLVRGPDVEVSRIGGVTTLPVEITGVTGPVRRSVPLDTSGFVNVQVSPGAVQIIAEIEALSERVLTEVPVTVQGDGGGWTSDPRGVMVTLRGPASRVAYLTRDSVRVLAPASGAARRETVRLRVIAPAGIQALVAPDTVQLQRRGR